ncbi:BgtE-640 [Blumeria graminis f. sp. tritici]|uniref:BgtE-640 n=3 Tax=Blumeria graminis f. sp. tritici TaxID=62690 RepID=A0A9X9LBR1_BLUGR|nr:BgtE-640 [Blumeria graminis f. sp. tritici]
MISCAFIFMLRHLDCSSPPENVLNFNPPVLERMVILGNDGGKSFYGAYDNPILGKFPVTDTKFYLSTTIKNNVEDGTNIKAYCSKTMSSVEIAELLGDIMSSETVENQDLVPSDPKYQICLAQIQKLTDNQGTESNHQHVQSPISAANLNQFQRCSNSDLINLAYRGQISVSGTFSYLAPPSQKAPLKVAMNQHIRFRDLAKSCHVYGLFEKEEVDEILIWYFDHLHIFRRNPDTPIWIPVTQIGSENRNGAVILNFIRKNTDALTHFNKIIRKSGLSSRLNGCLRGSISCDIQNKQNIGIIMAHISSIEFNTYPSNFKYF